MNYILGFLTLVLLILGIIFYKKVLNQYFTKKISSIEEHLTSETDHVNIYGRKDEFTVTVNERFSFLVKDGIIVGYKDSQKSNSIKLYSEE